MNKYYNNIALFGNKFVEEKEYWDKQLADGFEIGGILPDKKNSDMENYQKSELTFDIKEKMLKRIIEISGGLDYGIYAILISAVNYVIFKYSGNDDIVIGFPSLKQNNREPQVSNVLPMRMIIKSQSSFKEYLKETGKVLSDATKYKNLPFEIGEKNSDSLYYKTAVLLESIQDRKAISDFDFEIVISFQMLSNKIIGIIEYNNLLFHEETLKKVSEYIVNFLEVVINKPNILLSEIEILSEEEISQQLNQFDTKNISYPHDKLIQQLFEEQVEKQLDKIAIRIDWKCISYSDLNKKANMLARQLRNRGIKRDSIVGILTKPSIEMIVGIIAILKAGGAYLPIDSEYPIERIKYILEDSGMDILLTQSHLYKTNLAVNTLEIDNDEIYHGDDSNLEIINRPNDLAYIIYTSGTTGKPKGVMIEHENVVRLFFNKEMQFDFSDKDIWSLFHSYCFDFSVWEIYGALLYGGTLVIIPKLIAKDPKDFLKVLIDERVTILNQTPSAFYRLVDEERNRNSKLNVRIIIFGGEELRPLMIKSFQAKHPNIRYVNMYGITETTVHVTYKEITYKEVQVNISNIGKPIPTLTTFIMDNDRKLLPLGAVGELCVGGKGVGRGYLNRDKLTIEKFIINPYRSGERLYCSGDLVRMLPNGDMEYLGRKDHQVKIRGHRIELGEIENQLLFHENIREVIVISIDDDKGNKYICAYIVGDKELTTEELRTYLSKDLPNYMLPAYFIQLKKLPLTLNGKIDKKALPEPNGTIITGTQYMAARNTSEEKLVEVWQNILGVKRIGIFDNFFTLGGDSIKALRLVSEINARLNKELQIRSIYKYPTIKELSVNLETNEEIISADDFKKAKHEIELLKQNMIENENLNIMLSDNFMDAYPMSDIQQGMIYYYQKCINDAIYYDQTTYLIIDQNMRLDYLKKAISYMTHKHQILRTSFNLHDFSQPIQIVHKYLTPNIEYKDIRHLGKEDQQGFIKKILDEDRENIFDLSKPLWKIKAFVRDNDSLLLVLICHHAIFDGWSVASFITELSNVYFKIKDSNGEVSTPEELKHSYKDFVIEQLAIKNKLEIMDYWRNELGNYKRLNLKLNSDSEKVNETNEVRFYFDKELSNRIKIFSEKYNTNIKTVLFTAYAFMLNMLSYENDIVVGLVEHNRPICEDSDKILGCFLNSVPFRVKINKNMTWKDLVENINNKTLEIKHYGKLPLHEIVKCIGESWGNNNPIFDTLFNYIDFHILSEINKDLKDRKLKEINEFTYARTNTFFDFNVYNTFDKFEVEIDYKDNLFTVDEVNKLVQYFINTLNLIIESPMKIIDKIDVLTEEEKRNILIDFNNTKREYPKHETIHGLFEEQVYKNESKIAIVYNDKTISYKELNEKVNQIAMVILEYGGINESIIGIIMDSSIDMIASMLGILKAGGAYLTIDPEYPLDRIKYMLEDSGAEIILTKSHLFLNEMLSAKILNIDDDNIFSSNGVSKKLDISSNSLAYVMYTSGSTGKPKGVLIEHKSVVRLVKNPNYINFENEDKLLQTGSMVFDACTFEVWGMLLNGLELHLIDKNIVLNADMLEKEMKKKGITIIWLTTALFNRLTQQNVNIFSELRYLLVGGDVLSTKYINIVRENHPNLKILNGYGPTENTTFSTCFLIDKEYQDNIPIGTPISNSTVYIFDASNKLLPIGVIGELCVGGDGLARGYLNKKELTAEKFIDNPFVFGEKLYKTGDLARWAADGRIQFFGRIDKQVKIRGFRIELDEIKKCLLEHEDVKDIEILAKDDENGNKYLYVYFVAEKVLTIEELVAYLSESLPNYMIPSYFIQVDIIPLTINGKVDVEKLPDFDGNIITGKVYEAPQNETEEKLVNIWKELLKINKISINDNFFELGGHSLNAAILTIRISKEFTTEVPLNIIYNYRTIKEFASYLSELNNNLFRQESNNIVLIKKGLESKHNLFIIHGGSGEIEAYMHFCNYLDKSFDCWGIKSNRFSIEDDNKYDLEQIANEYINQIKEIQGAGPYYLMGWCVGGTIAFELARILEMSGDSIEILGLVNSLAPHKALKEGYQSFNLGDAESHEVDVNEYYEQIKISLRGDNVDLEQIKKAIPANTFNAIPDSARNTGKELKYYINTIRILDNARANYIPLNKVRAKMKFFNASRTPTINYKRWELYCYNPIEVVLIDSEHYSMFKESEVSKLAQEFNKLII